VIWVTRSEDPAKLNVTVVPGFCCANVWPSSVNVFFSDAAANTVTVPLAPGAAEPAEADAATDPDALADGDADAAAEAAVVVPELLLPELQAASDRRGESHDSGGRPTQGASGRGTTHE